MVAVASAPVINGSHDSDKEHNTDHSPSRFTAVNGRDVSVCGASAPTPSSSIPSNINDERREGVETGWGTSGYNTPSRQDERPQDGGSIGHDQEDRRSQCSSSQGGSAGANRNKRKRSESAERQASPQARSHPRSPVPRSDENVDPQIHPTSSNGAAASHPGHEPQNPSPTSYPRVEGNEDSGAQSVSSPWHDYDSQLISQAQRAQHLDTSDAQLAEALQREAQGQDPSQKNWGAVNRQVEVSAEVDQRSIPQAYTQERPQAAVQVAPKRKRVFSNRTKTGCLTCRRRKKKCDEQHPACNNCLRGGFLCEGYSSRSTWQKPSNAKGPVPLQSKEGYPDVSGTYVHEMSPQRHEPQSTSAQLEASKMRPLAADDNDRTVTQYVTSPTGVGPDRCSWSKRGWTGAGHSAYMSENAAKSEYREVPPIHELSREGHPKTDYHVVPPIRELSHGAHPKPGVPIFPNGADQRSAHVTNMDVSSPQAQARMALSIEHQLSTRPVSSEETEKEKMIRGELYRPFDIQLIGERERCKAALWKFNNACNPLSGISAKEQHRLLKEILIPPNSIANSPSGAPLNRPVGSIGQGAVVEAPFHCHYGYNIHIGEEVMISMNCFLVDDCTISIGAHTWIGPNVTILSSMAHANMQERKGSQSRHQGRPVTIEEDCYIGAGATIYPGVRLRRGAYVAPGEIVKSDIAAYGFQGLKPRYM